MWIRAISSNSDAGDSKISSCKSVQILTIVVAIDNCFQTLLMYVLCDLVVHINPGTRHWQSHCCTLQAEDIFSENRSTAQILERSAALASQLVVATETRRISLLPTELNTTNVILSRLIDVLEDSISKGTAPPNEVHSKNRQIWIMMINCYTSVSLQAIVDVLSNALEETNLNGWRDLQMVS